MTDWRKSALAHALPFVPPPVARSICRRAGLDHMVLTDRRDGFDARHYERSVGRRFRTDEAALFHYLVVGSRTSSQPRPGFDPARYLRQNPDVALAGYEPFAHYFRFGRHEGRGLNVEADDALPQPDLSRMLQYPARKVDAATVDIVMPVYGNRRLTLRAIDSVLASQQVTPFELLVIDDESPDHDLRRDLRLLADAGLLTLLVNEHNLGFVRTANRGMAAHPDRDVVLLNSDTEVYGNWLDRLMAVLRDSDRTATVSPLSNAATILSYPTFLRDNNPLPGIDFAALDRLCARLAHAPVELPTAVGFCMAIKRVCLAEVGGFDEGNFGRGYGEENDFSLRAIAAGWHHVAASNIFVWHRGGGSFGSERDALIEKAQVTLERLHPGYAASIQDFIALDPLRPVRESLDVARIQDDRRRKVLCAGGQPPWADDNTIALAVIPEIAPFCGQFRILATGLGATPNFRRLDARAPVDRLARVLLALDVEEVRVTPCGGGRAGPLPAMAVEAAHISGIAVTVVA